jgi:two-component system response regulator DevR
MPLGETKAGRSNGRGAPVAGRGGDASVSELAPTEVPSAEFERPIRVVVVDDHPVVRAGVIALLGADPLLEVVGEAGSAEEALALIDRLSPDVVVLDIRLPGMSGIEAGKSLILGRGDVRVVMLTSFSNHGVFRAALQLGVHGIVKKDSARVVLRHAVRTVGSGGRYVDPEVESRLSAETADARRRPKHSRRLTLMETQVLELLPEGLTNKEIAGLLGVSVTTVKTHLAHAMGKLELRSRSEAAASFALRDGLP